MVFHVPAEPTLRPQIFTTFVPRINRRRQKLVVEHSSECVGALWRRALIPPSLRDGAGPCAHAAAENGWMARNADLTVEAPPLSGIADGAAGPWLAVDLVS